MPNLKKWVGCDIGCGRDRSIIKLAQAFPNSRSVGYDVFELAGYRYHGEY